MALGHRSAHAQILRYTRPSRLKRVTDCAQFDAWKDIPSCLVEQHGDKLEEFVILRCATSVQPRAPWVVRISVSSAVAGAATPCVRMPCGRQKFAAFHGLCDGDAVVFCQRALSEFEVFVYRGSFGRNGTSGVSAVEAMCEPMQQLLALRGHSSATNSSITTTLPPISNFDSRFPMDRMRVLSSMTGESPPTNLLERAVSFSGIDTVYVDTPARLCCTVKGHPRIPKFLFNL